MSTIFVNQKHRWDVTSSRIDAFTKEGQEPSYYLSITATLIAYLNPAGEWIEYIPKSQARKTCFFLGKDGSKSKDYYWLKEEFGWDGIDADWLTVAGNLGGIHESMIRENVRGNKTYIELDTYKKEALGNESITKLNNALKFAREGQAPTPKPTAPATAPVTTPAAKPAMSELDILKSDIVKEFKRVFFPNNAAGFEPKKLQEYIETVLPNFVAQGKKIVTVDDAKAVLAKILKDEGALANISPDADLPF